MKKLLILSLVISLTGCVTMSATTTYKPQLLTNSYTSTVDGAERDYFVYLPKNYRPEENKKWPVMLFLHGNGERLTSARPDALHTPLSPPVPRRGGLTHGNLSCLIFTSCNRSGAWSGTSLMAWNGPPKKSSR